MGRKQHITYQNLQFVEKLVGFYHNLHLWKKFLLYTLAWGLPLGPLGVGVPGSARLEPSSEPNVVPSRM